ncbi:MAG: polysaccharide deacetylase family protein [Clostridiales Family XIII bacterium]|nr:polysaccharide deacetylase family protein [Clostridiales Family XIII bacterium]
MRRSSKNSTHRKRRIAGILLMAGIPALVAVFVVSSLIVGGGAQSGSVFAAGQNPAQAFLYKIAIRSVGGDRISRAADSVGRSRATDYVPQPKDEMSFRLDARRLIFAKPGEELKLEVDAAPPGADSSDVAYSSSDENVATVSEDGTVTATNYGKCTINAKLDGHTTSAAVTVAKKWVAITFDDGPGADTPRLLEAMKAKGVYSTFFIVGSNGAGEKGQERMKAVYKEGNEIANHTYDHNGSASNVLGSLKKADEVIKKATGKPAVLMRPPGGAINENTKKNGLPIIMWSLDPQDWKHRNADYVTDYVTKHVESGQIVLLHDIHKTSVDAAIRIFDILDKQGYAFMTVSQILDDPQPNTVYNKGSSSEVKTMKIPY